MKYKLLGKNMKINFIQEVLKNRGIDNYQEFLYSKEECVNDSSNLDHINEGCELLHSHLCDNSKILIAVDCDCDGVTSAAELYNFIDMIHNDNNLYYALHKTKAHGLTDDLYIQNNMKLEDFDLIILPDSSSNEYEQHYALRQLGIDILILD